jgi:ribosomal protein S18 acetylase RimI-like enzyme
MQRGTTIMKDLEEMRDVHTVRRLKPTDLERVVAIDALLTGRSRRGYFEHKLETNLLDSTIEASLAVDVDHRLVGFLLVRVWTGEFGASEPVAVLDTIGVHPEFQGRGIGEALVEQLITNLRGLHVATIRTEVGWDDFALLHFFHRAGFVPARRLCLDLSL